MNFDKVIGICKDAQFVFTTQDSFGLYLEFELDDKHGISFYLSSHAELETIRKILNKNKTGMAQDSISNTDLKKLIGLKAHVLTGGIGSRCYFKGFIHEVEIKN